MRSFLSGIAGLLALVAWTLASGAEMTGKPYDLSEPVWADDEKVSAFVLLPAGAGGQGPERASDHYPDLPVYLVGPVDPENAFRPEVTRQAMDPATGEPMRDEQGRLLDKIVIPAHDDTFQRFVGPDEPVDAMGHWVIPGPKATADTVRWYDMPENSLAGAPLAYAVFMDGEWQFLTNAAVIEQAIDSGLLEARFSNWGGVAWLERR